MCRVDRIDRPVRVHARVLLGRRDLVVHVGGFIAPVPQRDDDVALDAGRTWGHRRQGAGHDAVAPVGVHSERPGPEAPHHAFHLRAALPGPHAVIPRVHRRRKVERSHVVQTACEPVAELMTQHAALFQLVHVLRLRAERLGDAVDIRALARELVRGRNVQQ